MSAGKVVSVCPICGSSEVVHLCSAYLEAKTFMDRARLESKERTQNMDSESKETDNDVANMVSDFKVSDKGVEEETEEDSEECPKYIVIYLGSSYLDRRFPPQTAMPWVMGEVKHSRDTFKEVQLQICKSTLKAVAYEGLEQIETVFEHNLHMLSRFAKTHQDPRCFAYLRRQSLYSDYECHVFLANEENMVSLFIFKLFTCKQNLF